MGAGSKQGPWSPRELQEQVGSSDGNATARPGTGNLACGRTVVGPATQHYHDQLLTSEWLRIFSAHEPFSTSHFENKQTRASFLEGSGLFP